MGYSLYILSSDISERFYVGMTKDVRRRAWSHKSRAKNNPVTPVHCWIKAKGWENIQMDVLFTYGNAEDCAAAEMATISGLRDAGEPILNLHEGGSTGFAVTDESHPNWRENLRKARSGRKPALGMRHTGENRRLFSKVSRAYWSSVETYNPDEVLQFSFKDASVKFGISKTHYYRLRKSQQER